ncbi:putative RNA-binding protein 15B [Anguilla anguilla]|uniref:putative RNA-binding protein 15B n=1 Tax=Anguilla anguilla TaxID=7936 RepID=UPI0015AF1C9A|nr:putative RNA-binding protein 15B [Anguilla anguilla]
MKRQAERDSSPARGIAKRIRERERDRGGNRRDDGPPTPLAALLADSRNYHKRQVRSRSREREKPWPREERGAVGELHHRQHHHDLGLIGRPSLRTTAVPPKTSKAAAELLNTRGARGLEYKTLIISNLGSQLSDEHVEDGLFHEFKKFGDVSVKLSHTPELGRVAYVNFRHADDAKEARHSKARLVLYDRPLKVEPMYLRRRSCTPPDVGYVPALGVYNYRQRSLSPVPGASNIRDVRTRHYAVEGQGVSRERERVLDYYNLLEDRGRGHTYQPTPEDELKPEDDQRATRNLFIGNLDHSVSEVELRRSFEKYGIIDEVVIKRPSRGQGGAYAFLKFQNLDMAHRAKVAMQGCVVGGNPVKIGYGKANPTTRLWVGGLGPGTSLAVLAREFDRFGSIRTVDYAKGDSCAYIQYESLDAAQAACAQMRGFPLGGPERRLRVDFARAEEARAYPPQQQLQPPAGPPQPHYDLLPEAYGQRRSLEREPRAPRERSPVRGLFADRDRDRERERDRERGLADREWTSPSKSLERRGNPEPLGRGRGRSRSSSRERWAKEREERRKRRSLSGERQQPERGRVRGRGAGPSSPTSLDCSPNRPRGRAGEPPAEPPSQPAPPPCPEEVEQEPRRNHGDRKTDVQVVEEDKGGQEHGEKPPADNGGKPSTLLEYTETLTRVWQGPLVLKNSWFPTNMYMLEGGPAFLRSVMRESHTQGGGVSQLKIAQRLRMDQPRLDEVTRRIKLGGPDGYAVLLAVQGPVDRATPPPEPGLQRRLLRNLVTYLRNKQAAGVIGLPLGGAKEHETGAMLYAFPPGEFSQLYLQAVLRTLGKLEEEHLVIIIVKDLV